MKVSYDVVIKSGDQEVDMELALIPSLERLR